MILSLLELRSVKATESANIEQHRQKANTKNQTTRVRPRVLSWLFVFSLLITGLGGGFAPWIWRESVALQLTAPGLAEFVKFLPEIRTGQVQVERLYFLLPLFLAMLALPIVVENRTLALPWLVRITLRIAVIPFALISLSPVWTPAILAAPEFRLQTILAVAAILLAVVAPLFRGLPLRALIMLLIAGNMVALILPAWAFNLIQLSISEVYREPISLGWGWWLTISGIISSTVVGTIILFNQTR